MSRSNRSTLKNSSIRLLLATAAIAMLPTACTDEAPSALERQRSQRARLGRELIDAFGCGSCHVIPGAAAATGTVGPSLEGVGARSYIAGSLINTHDNLKLWLLEPQEIHPGTVMPDLDMTEEQAEAIAAYLGTLR